MQLIKLAAASLGVRAGIRFPGKRARARPGARSEGGQASVEFALLLVLVLFPFFFGVLKVGILVNQYLELTDAVGIGARQLAISAGQTTDPCNTAATTIQRAAPFLTAANLTFTFVINGTSYPGVSCSSSSTTTGAAGNMAPGAALTVTATYPCNLKIFGANLAPSGCTMTAQTTEIIQ